MCWIDCLMSFLGVAFSVAAVLGAVFLAAAIDYLLDKPNGSEPHQRGKPK